MRYEAMKDLNAEGFKRLTGVKSEVFRQVAKLLCRGVEKETGASEHVACGV